MYNVALFPLVRLVFFVSSFRNKKVQRGIEGRRDWKNRLRGQIEALKHKNNIIMFHATSVGELQQALPLIRLFKKRFSNISTGISFFSPSGYDFFKGDPDVDFVCYMPLDSWHNAKTFFSIVKPKCWIVSKFDVWPNHLYRCYLNKIPSYIISATLSSSSRRLNPFLAGFNKSIYSCFTGIFPISEDDRKRFETVFDKPEAMVVTGDTRFDQVVFRSQGAAEKAKKLPFYVEGRTTLMLGSIWESDAEVVLKPTVAIAKEFPALGCIITPHEPHEEFCKEIEDQFAAVGIGTVRYSSLVKSQTTAKERVIIIDTIGLLAQIYSISHIAYIGGSFGTGVHNVMEPAIMGVPVLFGPRHHNSFEALQMKVNGGAYEITTSEQYENIVRKLLNSDTYMRDAGNGVREYVLANVGAAQRIFNKLESALESNIS